MQCLQSTLQSPEPFILVSSWPGFLFAGDRTHQHTHPHHHLSGCCHPSTLAAGPHDASAITGTLTSIDTRAHPAETLTRKTAKESLISRQDTPQQSQQAQGMARHPSSPFCPLFPLFSHTGSSPNCFDLSLSPICSFS